jgi:hypothetical protein
MPDTIDRLSALTLPRPTVVRPRVAQPASAQAPHRPIWFGDQPLGAEPLLPNEPRVAVLIPCFNEEAAIGNVVADFRVMLPQATIYVYDNNSTDRTMREAGAAGALVRSERLQGKGHVVRRMFADIEADVFVLVDGDGTYDAAAAPTMVDLLLEENLDMVSAARESDTPNAYRLGHRLGNALLSGMVRRVFGHGVSDMLSGYRTFSRRFVKSFPALSSGFETETEFTVHALEMHMPTREIYAPYRGRKAGSSSKLHTVSDGWRILRTIVHLIEHERPMAFFAASAGALLLGGFALGLPVVWSFLGTGLVDRLPTALLATGLVLLSFLSLVCGLVLDAISRGRKELKRLIYLSIKP